MNTDLNHYRDAANTVEWHGHRIRFWRQVSPGKPWLLLVHGFPSASWDWHGLWPQLSQHFCLLAVDMLGFGLSDKPADHHYSLLEQADLLTHVLQLHDISNCHVLAHDYGNSVVQEMLYRQQQGELDTRLLSICWLNGGLFAESHRPLLAQRLLKSPLGPLFVRLMGKGAFSRSLKRIFGPDTAPESSAVEVLWWLLGYQQGRRVLPRLLHYLDERRMYRDRWVRAMQHTDIPLGFINGHHDPISGEHMLQRFQVLLPEAYTARLAVGHYPQIEAPQQVLSAYQVFVGDIMS